MDHATLTPVSLSELPGFAPDGAYIDSEGVAHGSWPGLRDLLKPGWRTMVVESGDLLPLPSPEEAVHELNSLAPSVEELTRYLSFFGGSLEGARVLEPGCYFGNRSFLLAAYGAAQVVATDLPAACLAGMTGDEPDEDALDAQSAHFVAARELFREVVSSGEIAARPSMVANGFRAARSVEFVDDDMQASGLSSGSFDLTISWETLEHVISPAAGFAELFRLTRPGGLAVHHYNPFFSLIGGHALCTIDIPWGHARLSDADFERYVRTVRPEEADVDLDFYRSGLNRMTIAGLRRTAAEAGFEVLDVRPITDTWVLGFVSADVLPAMRRYHPSVEIDDLLSTFVWITLRKP